MGFRFGKLAWLAISLASVGAAATTPARHAAIGRFTSDSDIGTVRQPGSATYDRRTHTYRVVGNGDDLWAARDDFHFVNRGVTGDVTLAATIAPVGGSTEPHSKAGLMFRQDLAPDSPYVDIVVHEDGMVALQYRLSRGGDTSEVTLPHTGPGRFRLERHGDDVTVAIADTGGTFRPTGASIRVAFAGAYRAGLLVCSHSDTQTRTVDFTDVRLTTR